MAAAVTLRMARAAVSARIRAGRSIGKRPAHAGLSICMRAALTGSLAADCWAIDHRASRLQAVSALPEVKPAVRSSSRYGWPNFGQAYSH